ncbi:MAG: helix-turn-helix domain-containing protein [Lentisphaeraceae bacterium]|nr:helix-turn-helix domain-containing protein [Lentisphaeraceae bacterium]
MKIKITDIDTILSMQDMYSLEMVPRKDLNWDCNINLHLFPDGCIQYSSSKIDMIGHLVSSDYRLLIPLRGTSEPHTFNGESINSALLITPAEDLKIIFPRVNEEIIIIFSKTFFKNMAELNQLLDLTLTNQVFSYNTTLFEPIIHFARKILNEAPINTNHYLSLILEKLFEIHSLNKPLRLHDSLDKLHLKLIHDFMQENIYKDLSVSQMCDYLKISRRPFEILFKRHYGTSPAAFFKRLKIMKIREELIENKLTPICEILKNHEIHHISHFGQFYKKIFNETMRETRKRL